MNPWFQLIVLNLKLCDLEQICRHKSPTKKGKFRVLHIFSNARADVFSSVRVLLRSVASLTLIFKAFYKSSQTNLLLQLATLQGPPNGASGPHTSSFLILFSSFSGSATKFAEKFRQKPLLAHSILALSETQLPGPFEANYLVLSETPK